ncbi:MAG: hypothetical protein AMJ53_07435 [Gammaproteobacteria bacterium SG8_11]|nr:MAG: hypothetical protein AMJ53_07435 [Gammaproteobacteria bacterium SG8_11]
MARHSNLSTIEHRFKQRKALNLDVVIYKNHMPVAVGKTRDISIEGMGVDSRIADIKKYCLLEIEVTVTESSNTVYHRLKGLVVHQHSDGFGILFTDLDPSESRIVDQLMLDH